LVYGVLLCSFVSVMFTCHVFIFLESFMDVFIFKETNL
jgi:hypothetical protein